MGDDAPDTVGLVIDTQDPNRDPGAAGRAAALGVGTQAVDAAVQGHKYAAEIHQTDGAHVAVAHRVLFKGLFIGVLTGLLSVEETNSTLYCWNSSIIVAKSRIERLIRSSL